MVGCPVRIEMRLGNEKKPEGFLRLFIRKGSTRMVSVDAVGVGRRGWCQSTRTLSVDADDVVFACAEADFGSMLDGVDAVLLVDAVGKG